MDWQPIETAPKEDGILAYIPEAPWHGEPHICEAFWSFWMVKGGGWRISDQDNGCTVKPSHWMPLPAPPTP